MNRKYKEVELFNLKVNLYERNAADVIASAEYSNTNGLKSIGDVIYNSIVVISDSLKLNYGNLKWYDIFKKISYNKKFSKKYILNNLSTNNILQLAKDVYVLDGLAKEDDTITTTDNTSTASTIESKKKDS